MRRISLDPDTVAVLAEHRQRYEGGARALAVEPSGQAFLFSHQPLHDAPSDPGAVTHRYGRMCAALGIDSHLNALRHYSATELPVRVKTVQMALGHSTPTVTLNAYVGLWPDQIDRTRTLIDEALGVVPAMAVAT